MAHRSYRTRSWSRRFVPILVVLLGLGLSGCAEDLNGERFVLESLGGHLLPAVEFDTGEERFVVEAETLVFTSSHRGRRSRRVRVDDAGGVISTTLNGTQAFSYELDGVDVSVTFDCPPNADCAEGPHLVGQRILGRLRLYGNHVAEPLLLEYFPLPGPQDAAP